MHNKSNMIDMKGWLGISMVLCTFGFFREMRPSEPFVTEFLSGEWRNITSEQVNRDVYPWGTYSYLAQLVIIFLVTDILRYKPIIVLSAIVGIILWCLLLWTTSLEALQIVQVCYGTFMAAEVAYYTYIYAKVDREKYQIVTGHTRSAILAGRFLASVMAQLLFSFDVMNVRDLNYISLGSQIVSLFFAIMLPSVGTSLYFYTKPDLTDSETAPSEEVDKYPEDSPKKSQSFSSLDDTKPVFSFRRAVSRLWSHFTMAYSNWVIIQWSLWWSLAMCGFLLIQSYIQLLWQQIQGEENMYNGAVEAALTLFGALAAFGAGFLHSKKFEKWGLWILTLCSAVEGGLILVAAFTDAVWVSYVMYVLFGTLYHFMITMVSAMVANRLLEDSFALIFGINTLVALIFQSILTVVVISESGFALDPRGQFTVFGSYFLVLAVIYGITGVVSSLITKFRTNSVDL